MVLVPLTYTVAATTIVSGYDYYFEAKHQFDVVTDLKNFKD